MTVGEKRLSHSQALEQVTSLVTPIDEWEKVGLRQAYGRILHTAIHSPIAVPMHTNSAMDGYAMRAADLPSSGRAPLTVIATIHAGELFPGVVKKGQAVRLMTGATVPNGADTVIIQEDVELDQENSTILIGSGHKSGQHIRSAGEDHHPGDLVVEQGIRLGAAELSAIASVGIAEVSVYRRLRVAYFSTGDELVPLGSGIEMGQVYDSNRYALHALLADCGVVAIDLGVVKDDLQQIQNILENASKSADLVISTAGASVGEADLMVEAMSQLGQIHFWKVAIKPGRPMAFGQLGKAVYFGLPGNPVSVIVTFQQFVQYALRLMGGEAVPQAVKMQVRCVDPLRKRPGRREYQRGVLIQNADGEVVVRSTGAQGSGILRSLTEANCYIILPEESAGVVAGEMVEIEPILAKLR